MSAGNGTSEFARPRPLQTAQLSAAQRSEQTDRTIAQVQALKAQGNALVAQVDLLTKRANDLSVLHAILDRCERLEAFVSRPFLARLRWIVTGR